MPLSVGSLNEKTGTPATRSRLVAEIVTQQRRLGQLFGQYAASIWIESGLTIVQLKSLFLIASQGSLNFRKLAKALGVTPSNVTGIVDRLVAQGLVSRSENPEDRRMMTLEATDKGRAILSNLKETGLSHMTEILSHLSTEELSSLARGLTALVKAADKRGNIRQ